MDIFRIVTYDTPPPLHARPIMSTCKITMKNISTCDLFQSACNISTLICKIIQSHVNIISYHVACHVNIDKSHINIITCRLLVDINYLACSLIIEVQCIYNHSFEMSEEVF